MSARAISESRMEHPQTLREAVTALQDPGAVALAGGTWVMRSPIRNEPWAETYVALRSIAELRQIEMGVTTRFGACLSHAELAAATAGQPWLEALHRAAAESANPAIRRVATLGGNLCATGFPAADLIPALFALDASVGVSTAGGEQELPLGEFLSQRASLCSRGVVRGVILRTHSILSGHARLPLRVAGGDYAAAIVSIALARDAAGLVEEAMVGVGSVESVARRWPELEQALLGAPIDPDSAAAAAQRSCHQWRGRDGVDAPGWYRVQVLPALVRRAMNRIVAAAEAT